MVVATIVVLSELGDDIVDLTQIDLRLNPAAAISRHRNRHSKLATSIAGDDHRIVQPPLALGRQSGSGA